MTRVMLGKPKELFVSSYFAARRFVVEEMVKYENSYPYVIGLVLRTTKNIVNVEVNHRDRAAGESGYTFSKLLGLWFNGFTAFSVKPLRIATATGAGCAVIGFLYGLYTIIKRSFQSSRIGDWLQRPDVSARFCGRHADADDGACRRVHRKNVYFHEQIAPVCDPGSDPA